MALPNEHQLTFSQYFDAKTMFAAIETRFGGNAATKKTQKTLLKQQYENFSASSAESLDSAFNRLQKINPNGSNLLHQDLEQIHEDDLEAIDLKWQLSLLSMRAKRYYQRTDKKIFINANDTAGFDKSKQGNNEDRYSKAMLAIDGVGFDWSDMAEEQVQTNITLMVFSDSELNQIEFTATTYKGGLATLEEKLITYRKNEVLFSEKVAVLKREVACKDYE
ncbi:hypothetical protein Tco_1564729 [Tanacetum coccineum]